MSHETPAEPSADEITALTALLDELVPPSPERGLPGAGELGLAHELVERVPELLPMLRPGLAALDEEARRRGAGSFAALARPERAAAIREREAQDAGFLPGLLYHGYARYYQHPRVLEALGLEARPPYPQGYAMEPTDPERLAAMRRRPPLYREC